MPQSKTSINEKPYLYFSFMNKQSPNTIIAQLNKRTPTKFNESSTIANFKSAIEYAKRASILYKKFGMAIINDKNGKHIEIKTHTTSSIKQTDANGIATKFTKILNSETLPK